MLGQPNPVHIPTSHLLEIHPNIIHPSTPRSPQWSPSLQFPHQDPIHPPLLTHTRHMPSPSHSSDFITRTILGEEYKSYCWKLRSTRIVVHVSRSMHKNEYNPQGSNNPSPLLYNSLEIPDSCSPYLYFILFISVYLFTVYLKTLPVLRAMRRRRAEPEM